MIFCRIATGARPRPLDLPGHEHLVDSTGFLDLPELPRRILFVGGGFISFEFAHIAARAGSTPVILDRQPRPLKAFDPDLVDLLIDQLMPHLEKRQSHFAQPDFPYAENWWWVSSKREISNKWLIECLDGLSDDDVSESFRLVDDDDADRRIGSTSRTLRSSSRRRC